MYFNIDKKFDLDIENLNNPIILIGWPGIALVAKLAISSIKDSIKADLFLDILYFDFPPKSTVENGSLEIPTAKVYYKSRDLKNDIFILTANFQPQSPEGVFEFSKNFCEEMDKITDGKIKMYVSTGALVSENITNEPKVHVCCTDKDLIHSFLKLENTKVMDGGIIAGANGILPAWAGAKGFAPGVCLLAETVLLPMMNLDPRASKALVTILKNYFKIDMNFDELDKKINEMQNIFDSFKKQADYFMKGAREDKGPDSYFR
ncbi:MAG: PAC2 family protein [Promethearchaeota archaeon]